MECVNLKSNSIKKGFKEDNISLSTKWDKSFVEWNLYSGATKELKIKLSL